MVLLLQRNLELKAIKVIPRRPKRTVMVLYTEARENKGIITMREIVLCLKTKEDEILSKQVAMLSERHHASVKRVSADEARSVIETGNENTLFISDDETLLNVAKEKGLLANSPMKMKESYAKAMEMLKTIGVQQNSSKKQ